MGFYKSRARVRFDFLWCRISFCWDGMSRVAFLVCFCFASEHWIGITRMNKNAEWVTLWVVHQDQSKEMVTNHHPHREILQQGKICKD